jgi:hypothetical protein
VFRSILLAATIVAPASAHEVYSRHCCRGTDEGGDCHPISDDDVRATPRGWFLKDTGQIIPYDQTEISPDGRFHGCDLHWRGHLRYRCLYVPLQGS